VNFRIFGRFNDINTNLQILFLFSEKSARFFCESPHFFAVMPLNIKCSEWNYNGLALKQKHKKHPFADASASHLSLVLWHV